MILIRPSIEKDFTKILSLQAKRRSYNHYWDIKVKQSNCIWEQQEEVQLWLMTHVIQRYYYRIKIMQYKLVRSMSMFRHDSVLSFEQRKHFRVRPGRRKLDRSTNLPFSNLDCDGDGESHISSRSFRRRRHSNCWNLIKII